MNKELEEAIKMFSDLNMGDDTEFIKSRNIILNYIDNSISKEKVENKIEVLKIEEHYDYIDNKKAINILQELIGGLR